MLLQNVGPDGMDKAEAGGEGGGGGGLRAIISHGARQGLSRCTPWWRPTGQTLQVDGSWPLLLFEKSVMLHSIELQHG